MMNETELQTTSSEQKESPSSGYELMHEPDFPVLRVGSRMLVPKEKFIRWAEEHKGGAI